MAFPRRWVGDRGQERDGARLDGLREKRLGRVVAASKHLVDGGVATGPQDRPTVVVLQAYGEPTVEAEGLETVAAVARDIEDVGQCVAGQQRRARRQALGEDTAILDRRRRERQPEIARAGTLRFMVADSCRSRETAGSGNCALHRWRPHRTAR